MSDTNAERLTPDKHFQLLLNSLSKPRRLPDGSYQARCIAHDDRSPSLNVKLSRTGKLLIKCYAGCSADAVCAAAGIPLFLNSEARPLTQTEIDEQRRQQEEVERIRIERQAAVAIQAQKEWAKLLYADGSNPYCKRKRVQPHGCKTGTYIPRNSKTGELIPAYAVKNCLVVPMYDATGELMNLQYIYPAKPANDYGDKRNLSGGQVKGTFFILGEEITETILLAEGFSTAASLFEDSGFMTYISFGSGNLSITATIVRNHHPKATIIVCGDNDEHGKGQEAAQAAALVCRGKWMIPPVTGDFNDYINSKLTNAEIA
jgi:putative DNA primase/helicase